MAKQHERSRHEIIVGNIGTVYDGDKANTADAKFITYVNDSKSGRGRAADEPVTWIRDGEIHQEYHPVTVHLTLLDAPHGRKNEDLAQWLEDIARELRADVNKRHGTIVGQKWKIDERPIERD